MPNFCLTLSYDGTDFVGWQRQRNGLSVQEALEDALGRLLEHPVICRAAGRTDAGVHARGQVVSFRTEKRLPLRALLHGSNHHLPASVAVLDVKEVADDFDARHSASGKLYRYQIWNAPVRSPLHARTYWHLTPPLDRAQMAAAAAVLVGRHDFAAFRASNCERLTTVRTVKRVAVCAGPPEDGGASLCIEVEATAFLKNMVRILTGTLVQVGRGRMGVEHVQSLLRSCDRTQAGPTAPPHGLTLWRVDYGPREGP